MRWDGFINNFFHHLLLLLLKFQKINTKRDFFSTVVVKWHEVKIHCIILTSTHTLHPAICCYFSFLLMYVSPLGLPHYILPHEDIFSLHILCMFYIMCGRSFFKVNSLKIRCFWKLISKDKIVDTNRKKKSRRSRRDGNLSKLVVIWIDCRLLLCN